ncbi:MAG: hypothetical protein ACRDY7_08850 [Acidimicrobiia bacterium]
MRTLRMAAIGGLVALTSLSVAASPAASHPEHGQFMTWEGPNENQPVSGSEVHIRGRVAFGEDGVSSWAVEVVPAPGSGPHGGYGTVCERAIGGSPAPSAEIDCVWDTTVYPADKTIAHNGAYVIRVTARNGEAAVFSPPPADHTAERVVRVVNPTRPPSNVKLSFAESAKQATVQWSANPEPDVARYVVQERVGKGEWKTVGETGSKVTTFTRRLGAPGTYHYQVAALRLTGSGDQTIRSAWAAPTGKTRQVVVAEPPPPTTTSTTAPEDGGDQESEPDPRTAAESPAAGGAGAAPPSPDGSAPAAPEAGEEAPEGDEAADEPAPAGPDRDSIVTPITPGRPGNVTESESFEAGVGERRERASAAAPRRPARPRVREYPDGPFERTLPYPEQAEPAAPAEPEPAPVPEEVEPGEEAFVELGAEDSGDDARQTLVPMAGGLLLFVLAMLALHVNRRAGVEALEAESPRSSAG